MKFAVAATVTRTIGTNLTASSADEMIDMMKVRWIADFDKIAVGNLNLLLASEVGNC